MASCLKTLQIVYLQFLCHALNKLGAARERIHRMYQACATGNKLQRNAAYTRKKVKYIQLVPIQMIAKNVEQAFFGRVGGGADRQVAGGLKSSSLKGSAYDAHVYKQIK